MAKTSARNNDALSLAGADGLPSTPHGGSSRESPPAQERYSVELAFPPVWNTGSKPSAWVLTPKAAATFICGSRGETLRAPFAGSRLRGCYGNTQKFVNERAIVERCVVTLAGERELLLTGETGTAKSMLSEFLSTAISGGGSLTIQGIACSSEEHLRYSWDYALLLPHGPVESSLAPSPMITAMKRGQLPRVEDVTRCLPEVQDALISILSERRMMVPELSGDAGSIFVAPGFNVIATANHRDKAVSEMSTALMRRFNF